MACNIKLQILKKKKKNVYCSCTVFSIKHNCNLIKERNCVCMAYNGIKKNLGDNHWLAFKLAPESFFASYWNSLQCWAYLFRQDWSYHDIQKCWGLCEIFPSRRWRQECCPEIAWTGKLIFLETEIKSACAIIRKKLTMLAETTTRLNNLVTERCKNDII